ncbi:hypothetical protein C4D60_Mb04t30750 [Musa balbisiana]|uniref:Uncharacterized protein n=1 Tax=Musa balbisiana TaxID=52838 RepID=A0A4S8KFU9_MUSBA|nr:hypothetical protein C4D60_Mb04t30750 [Musa balbisiana]
MTLQPSNSQRGRQAADGGGPSQTQPQEQQRRHPLRGSKQGHGWRQQLGHPWGGKTHTGGLTPASGNAYMVAVTGRRRSSRRAGIRRVLLEGDLVAVTLVTVTAVADTAAGAAAAAPAAWLVAGARLAAADGPRRGRENTHGELHHHLSRRWRWRWRWRWRRRRRQRFRFRLDLDVVDHLAGEAAKLLDEALRPSNSQRGRQAADGGGPSQTQPQEQQRRHPSRGSKQGHGWRQQLGHPVGGKTHTGGLTTASGNGTGLGLHGGDYEYKPKPLYKHQIATTEI